MTGKFIMRQDTYDQVHHCLRAWLRMAGHMLYRAFGEEVLPYLKDRNGLRVVSDGSGTELTLAVQYHALLKWSFRDGEWHTPEKVIPVVLNRFTQSKYYANHVAMWLGRTLEEMEPWIELLASQEAQALYELELLAV